MQIRSPEEFLKHAVEESITLKKSFFEESKHPIISFYKEFLRIEREGRTAFFFGNGGSAADAQHFAAELMHRVEKGRIGIPAIALNTDTSLLTALGNDEGFDQVFAKQLQTLARAGDLAVAISTSGNSKNILEALRTAKEKQCFTVGLLGNDGGKARELCDLSLIVPHTSTPRIQEVHEMILHLVCQLLENRHDVSA